MTPVTYFSTVSREASAKSGENNGGLVRLQGIAIFAEVRASASKAGQKVAALVFSALCGMAKCEKKPPAESLFWLLFVATKSN